MTNVKAVTIFSQASLLSKVYKQLKHAKGDYVGGGYSKEPIKEGSLVLDSIILTLLFQWDWLRKIIRHANQRKAFLPPNLVKKHHSENI